MGLMRIVVFLAGAALVVALSACAPSGQMGAIAVADAEFSRP